MAKRVDPADGSAYTWDEISAFYKGTYKKNALEAYWEDTMKPVKTKGKGKAAPEPKAKAKAKAKTKAKAKARPERGPACPKRFINADADIVTDAMDGLVWATPNLARLDTFPDIKVAFRTDWKKEGVALISGGGAGHEPMHGGFVGKGMLTAAISGETFASPTIDAVLSAILHVTGDKGCLLIIKNYTGDRLNFTLAAQRAREMFKLKVEIVITCDDVATVAERGVAGTLFVHKVAGAAAEAGKSLEDVKKVAEEVIASSASEGVSFSSVRRLKAEMIKPKQMEIGLGIHGEPGARTEEQAPVAKIVDGLMEDILKGKRVAGEAPNGYACLVNNLGGIPPIEMSIITGTLMKSKYGEKIRLLIGPAALCTSLDMNGFSLSLLKLTPELAAGLLAATVVVAWPAAVEPSFPKPMEFSKIVDPMEGVVASSDEAISAVLVKVCEALVKAKKELDDLDAKVGDADCGSTMAAAAAGVMGAKDKLPFADPAATCSCLGAILAKTMGGSSGVLMSIMFTGMAAAFRTSGKKTWAEGGGQALMHGLEAMMAAGGATTGSRTMLDAFVPAAQAIIDGKGLAGASAAAAAGVEATKTMTPRAGRSENVPESMWKSVPDPGAKAVSIAFAATL